jgi:hypothetical protein
MNTSRHCGGGDSGEKYTAHQFLPEVIILAVIYGIIFQEI